MSNPCKHIFLLKFFLTVFNHPGINLVWSSMNIIPIIASFFVPTVFIFIQLCTDAEKRSLVESGLSWFSEDSKGSDKLSSSSYDTGSLKTEAQSKWRKKILSLTEEPGVKGELRKPLSLSQQGSFKKGRNPPVGMTSPITQTSQSTLKVAGKNQRYNFIVSVFVLSLWPLQCWHICWSWCCFCITFGIWLFSLMLEGGFLNYSKQHYQSSGKLHLLI